MDNSILLFEVAAIMIVAGISAILFSRMRAPVIIGYLFAGIILGSDLFSSMWEVETETVNFLADLGIILLMFSIGLDFNLKRLKEIGGFAILAGSIEVAIMMIIGYEAGLVIGWDSTQSIFLGAVLSISSTAIIFRTLSESGRIGKPYADSIIGILIIEDLAAVIILTMISPLAAGQTAGLGSLFLQVIAILTFMALSLVLGVAILPRVINRIGHDYDDEVLLLVSLGLCFSMAMVAYLIGLSVAIGAFIIGVIISESDQGERIARKVCSIKEMFLAIFFVSIGLLIDPMLVLNNLPLVFMISLLFIVGKTVAVSIACTVAAKDARTSLTTGLGMVAMGEFSFVIARVGVDTGVVSNSFYSVVIGAAMVTMVAMPVFFNGSDRIIDALVKRMPTRLLLSVKRVEGMRSELDRCLSRRADRRRRITLNLLWIAIDLTVLFVVQLIVLTIYDISAPLEPIADWINVSPSLFASVVSVSLIIPPVIDMLFRVRKIGYEAVQGVLEGGMYHWDSGRLILKIFVNMATAFLGVIVFLAVLPFASEYAEIPVVPIAGGIIAAMVIWLLWDANKSTYKKMCSVLTGGLVEPGAKK
ncbi:MAG: cation:proton antiporter [Methanomassiliicoccales archaeon]|jgi:CPA2 family monovalent cation:H+ antiporter-2